MFDRSFRALWFGTGAANLGDGVTLVLLPLVAVLIGASPSGVAAITVAGTLAWPLLGLHAGWIVDRFERRRILLCANFARAMAVGVATMAAATGNVSLALLLTVSLAYGVAETLVDTALTSTVADLVPPARRNRANARIEGTINATNQLVGPPLAGALVGLGTATAFGAAAGMYLAAALAVLLIRPLRRGPTTAAADAAGDAAEDVAAVDGRVRAGLVTLWRQPLLRSLTLVTAAMNLVWAAFGALFVVHAVAPGPMRLSPAAYGLLLTAMAVGGLLAMSVVEPLRRAVGARRLLLLDCVGTVLLVAPTALGWGLWSVVVGVVVAGAGSSVWRVLVATIRQHAVPSEILGRVYAASRVISWGSLPVGAAAAGALAELTSVRVAFAVATAMAVAVVGWFVAVARRHDLDEAFRAAVEVAAGPSA